MVTGPVRRTRGDDGGDPKLEALLERLHAESGPQVEATAEYFRARAASRRLSWEGLDERAHRFRGPSGAYFDFVAAPENGLMTRTLPFAGGLEFTVKAR